MKNKKKRLVRVLRIRYLKLKKALISGLYRLVSALDHKPKKYFRNGDLVELVGGLRGRVWKVYKSVVTREVIACVVVLKAESSDHEYIRLAPAEDKGKEFNPVIRRVQK